MANNGPLGSDTNPGLIDGGTSALTHHRPPGPLCASRPTDTQLEHHLGRLLHHLSVATGWIDTSSVIGSLLGNGSFTAGVVAGMGKNLVTSLVDLTRLFRMFTLAEYHQAHHAPSFWERLGHRVLYETMPLGGMSVSALTFGTGIDLEAEKAFEDRQALFKAVAYAFEHPGEVFDKITAQQLAKYEEFKRAGARHTLSGDFHAGLLFGELLLDVLLIIDGATALAKLGAKVPGLLRMASRLEELAPALRRALKTGGAAAEDAAKSVERVTPSQIQKISGKGSGGETQGRSSSMGRPSLTTGEAEIRGIPVNGALRNIPLGFKNESQFLSAARDLQDALRASGIDDAVVGVRGSSVTGRSLTKGTSFGPESDIDFFVESSKLTERYKASKRIPGFVHPDKILPDYPLLEKWAEKWSEIIGRAITPGAFQPGMLPKQPSILVK